MPKPKLYRVVVALPRHIQQFLHKEQAQRQLNGQKQTIAEIASEWLTERATDVHQTA